MSWSFGGHRGSANSKTSGAVLTVVPTGTIPAGAIAVAVCATDNVGTTGGQSETHVVADFVGNPWQKVVEWTNAAAAAAGITGSVWITRVRKPLTTADPVVLGIRAAVASRAIGLYEYGVSAGSTARMVAAVGSEQDNTSSPTVTVNSLASAQYAMFGVCFREADTAGTYTMDADYNERTKFGTTGGVAATNVSAIVGDRVATLIGDTFAPTALSASGDVVTVLIAMQEIPLKTPVLSFNDSSVADLQAELRAFYRTAAPGQLCKAAHYVEGLALSDVQLKTLFGIDDAQLPGFKARLGNQSAIYDAIMSQAGQ